MRRPNSACPASGKCGRQAVRRQRQFPRLGDKRHQRVAQPGKYRLQARPRHARFVFVKQQVVGIPVPRQRHGAVAREPHDILEIFCEVPEGIVLAGFFPGAERGGCRDRETAHKVFRGSRAHNPVRRGEALFRASSAARRRVALQQVRSDRRSGRRSEGRGATLQASPIVRRVRRGPHGGSIALFVPLQKRDDVVEMAQFRDFRTQHSVAASARRSARFAMLRSSGWRATSTAAMPPCWATLTTCFCETRHIVPSPLSVAQTPSPHRTARRTPGPPR